MKSKPMIIINGVLLAALGVLTYFLVQQGQVSGEANRDLPVVKMNIGSKIFEVEITRTERERNTGLMHRRSMPDDHGMIFGFRDEEVRGFWMKNVQFPLDIIFCDSAGTIVSIKQMKEQDENTTSSDRPAQYAIELNKDMAQKAGVKVGDKLEIPPEARRK